jgi:hypothetical protein
MFHVTKMIRMSPKYASENFTKGTIGQMQRDESGKDVMLMLPFKCPVVGCGSEAPEDYETGSRAHFKILPEYGVDQLGDDVRDLVTELGLETVLKGLNQGIDLQLRVLKRQEKADKPRGGRMSQADKVLWIMTNAPEQIAKIGLDPEKLSGWYDENVRDSNEG